ncbi:16S rRNA (uracil(1498)-N(3))-methyltransferase [Pseudomaricurvus alcaniphilus]|uniref:16S rRNA (uracil(1498)-N(3))-methyltransferase n=1 Tax=Pseudomaricurvus alcaniphilus TaxID=1166482 RepID=UPI0014083166|nr:16S rRNA (uracil(1498)-N(3))-methyltransferase [Pseudomaricurvus alcaniphilus]NHN38710.1 16S rRNA (uracil(1498)-N(3))-methyltransferase [Pseudomaricurvus alcaniphilus]
MRIPRLYTCQPLNSGAQLTLDASAAHYLGRVLRMEPGRPLLLFNGEGGEFNATLLQLDKKSALVEVGEFAAQERESPLAIHLGIGISRGERMDWVLQKATELGVSAVTPLFTERSEVKLRAERLQKKQQHWQQIMISACEQSQRTHLPDLQAPQEAADWLASISDPCRFILHHRTDTRLSAASRPTSVTLAIGPEGGFSDTEIERALALQFQPLALGPRVLRTETAPVAAISILQFLWGDLS